MKSKLKRRPVQNVESSQPHSWEKVDRLHPLRRKNRNTLLGRMVWDFLGEKYWSDLMSKKIQMKLRKIKFLTL